MEASFELLVSIANLNKFGLSLDLAKGSLQYDGVEFGSFEVNSMILEAESINDDIIAVSISPTALDFHPLEMIDKINAGTLFFTVNSEIKASVPSLFGYTFSGKLKDYAIYFNEELSNEKLKSRELCACNF